jgi:hypothetical protein
VPALLRIKTFVTGLIINLTFESAMLGFFLPFTLMLQIGLGYDVITAALTGIPTAIGISVMMAAFSQKIIAKLGRYTLTLGVLLMASGLILLYAMLNHFRLDMSPFAFIPGLLLVGSGMALIMSPMFSVALADVDAKHAGSASGVLNSVQQVGGSIGVALLGLFFFGHIASHAPASFDTVAPQIKDDLVSAGVPAPTADVIVATTKTCYVDRSSAKDTSVTPPSCKALEAANSAQGNSAVNETLDASITASIKQATNDNFVSSFGVATIFELAILAVVFGLSFLLPRHIRVSEEGLEA